MYLPKRGQAHELTANAKRVELVLLNPIVVAKRLKARFGTEYSADTLGWINQCYPNGMTETKLQTLLAGEHLPTMAQPLQGEEAARQQFGHTTVQMTKTYIRKAPIVPPSSTVYQQKRRKIIPLFPPNFHKT